MTKIGGIQGKCYLTTTQFFYTQYFIMVIYKACFGCVKQPTYFT